VIKLTFFGRGYNEIKNKEIGLKDYHFSITMENHTYPLAYSEKISDCLQGPYQFIWYDMIGDVFNMDGIIMLNENFNINDLTPELYYNKIDAINDNYNRVINVRRLHI
jgi:hypothetical protein